MLENMTKLLVLACLVSIGWGALNAQSIPGNVGESVDASSLNSTVSSSVDASSGGAVRAMPAVGAASSRGLSESRQGSGQMRVTAAGGGMVSGANRNLPFGMRQSVLNSHLQQYEGTARENMRVGSTTGALKFKSSTLQNGREYGVGVLSSAAPATAGSAGIAAYKSSSEDLEGAAYPLNGFPDSTRGTALLSPPDPGTQSPLDWKPGIKFGIPDFEQQTFLNPTLSVTGHSGCGKMRPGGLQKAREGKSGACARSRTNPHGSSSFGSPLPSVLNSPFNQSPLGQSPLDQSPLNQSPLDQSPLDQSLPQQ